MAELSTPPAKLGGKVLPRFLRRVPYRPITLLDQGTAGQSPQGFPRCALSLLKTCPSQPFLCIRHLLADSSTDLCFFVILHYHCSHRDRTEITSRLSSGLCVVTLASKLPRGSTHCTSTTPWCHYISKAFTLSLPLKTSQRGLWRLHTAVGAGAALSPYPPAARIGNAAFQVIVTNHPTS